VTTAPDWAALGEAVKARRAQLRLPQDLARHGGPSDITVRKIERAEVSAIRNQTRTQLEAALRWPSGHVDRLLAGEASPDDDRLDWLALGTEVRRRRALMHLRQADLEARGGPGAGTVRNIEQASRTSYAHRTFVQLETALDWPDGVVERILRGTATRAEIDDAVTRGLALAVDEHVSTHIPRPLADDDAHALRVGRLVLALWRELAAVEHTGPAARKVDVA
jgi:transcriptional regulator with XRE-family HTH domain